MGRARAPQATRCHPGVQARRHVRGRVPEPDALSLLDLLRHPRTKSRTTAMPRTRPGQANASSCSAAAPTASARASSSTTAACTQPWHCASSAIETVMINSNPETVSTDFDTSDMLFFEPLTHEDVMNVIDRLQPRGVIVQFGGQTPLNLARGLQQHGAPLVGTSVDMIDSRRGPRPVQQADQRSRHRSATERHGRGPPNEATRRRRRASATRCWCGRASCSVAARWRSSTTAMRSRTLHGTQPLVLRRAAAAGRQVSGRRDRGRRRRDRRRRGRRHRRRHGAHRGSRHPLRRLELLAAAVHAVGRHHSGDHRQDARRSPKRSTSSA